MKTRPIPHPTHATPSLLRRLGAAFYDGLLLLSIWFMATLLLLPLTGGEAIAAHNPLYTTYLFMISFFFFGWFWTHGGQTLGMRAWRLKVQRRDGGPVTWWHCLLRFMVAILSWLALGLGFFWMYRDRERRTWHDRYSETELVLLPKRRH